MKKTPKIQKIESTFNQSIDNLLHEFYLENQISTFAIGKLLNVDHKTIKSWLLKYNIPIRHLKDASKLRQKYNPSWITQKGEHTKRKNCKIPQIENKYNCKLHDLLNDLYSNHQYNAYQISQILKVSELTVYNWLKECQIQTRSGIKIWEIIKRNSAFLQRRKEIAKCPERIRKISEASKIRWQNPDYRQKRSNAMKQLWKQDKYIQSFFAGLNRSPNKPEKLLNNLIPSDIKYSGNGSFWRTLPNGKHSNPDFIVEPIKKTKQVIFLHGLYWHQNELYNRGQDLINQWNQLGYDCLIIWEDELDNIKSTLDKIATFINITHWQLNLF